MAPAAQDGGLSDGLYARIHIRGKGDIVCRLNFETSPLTVMNFVGLAEGKLDNKPRPGKPYYDGLAFHRVIAGFMAQGGDPTGLGTGGPGYFFPSEINRGQRHDAAGLLSMAHAGHDANGSQFFITFAPAPHLDDPRITPAAHAIFGRVTLGKDVLASITQGDVMERVEILRTGAAARAFEPTREAFDLLRGEGARAAPAEPAAVAERLRRNALAFKAAGVPQGADWFPDAIGWAERAKKTAGGSLFTVIREGRGEKPEKGQTVLTHYAGRLLTGRVFDASWDRGEPFPVRVGAGEVIPAWDEALLDMKAGEKRALFAPPNQAYGDNGIPGTIPQRAMLYFEMERL